MSYYLVLVWVAFVYLISSKVNVFKTEHVCGRKVQRYKVLWSIIAFLPLIYFAGYRDYVGDTWAYKQAFLNMPDFFEEIEAYMKDVNKDKGFYYLSAVLKTWIGDHFRIYFLIIAAIQSVFIIFIYRKYSINYAVSIFLFVASTDYLSWMYNGIRQFLAVTIILGCFPLILKKKYLPSIIIIVLAAQLHASAYLVIPFIFIVEGNPWNKKTLLFIIGIIISVVFLDRFTNILENAVSETQYGNVFTSSGSWMDDGTSILRVLVYSVPAILSLVGKRYITIENDPVINLCVNMSIITMGFYIISVFTSGVLIGRIPIYFSMYNYILLPWEIEHMFNRKSAKLVNIVMIGAYLFFYYFQLHFSWGMI